MARVDGCIPQKHKDPTFVPHLRPITLLNVDYKLVTKALALHMRPLLPDLIHTDQNGFVQNRYLGNNVLDVYSFMTLAEEAVEKAFDSIDRGFLRFSLSQPLPQPPPVVEIFPKLFISLVTILPF